MEQIKHQLTTPFLLGRLFCEIEGISAGEKMLKYFNQACERPKSTYLSLIAIAKKNNKLSSRAIEIIKLLPAIYPDGLSYAEQTSWMQGYYHQKATLYGWHN